MDFNKLLYSDEDGNLVGFDEVQLIDPIPTERIPILLDLLTDKEPFRVCEAAILLTSWGVDEGIEALENLFINKIHETVLFAPNRINGKDNIYDEFAYSIHLYLLSDGNRQKSEKVLKLFLSNYANFYFEGKIKRVLLKHPFENFEIAIKTAIDDTIKVGLFFQASQLLPAITQFNSQIGWEYINKFIKIATNEPIVEENIAESLKYIEKRLSKELLNKYSQSQLPLVRRKALESLSIIN